MLAQIEEMNPVFNFQVDFGKKDQTAHVSSLFKDERRQGIVRGKSYYVAELVLPFAAVLADRTLVFLESCD